jgi:hypothetical protein
MSCNNFNSNTQPKVIFSGALPAGFCHTTWATTFATFRDSLAASLPDNYSTFIVSDTTPIASDRDKAWVQVDPSNCRPIGIKLYLNGTWIQIGASSFYGVDSGSANAVLVNTTSPDINWAQTGHMFLIKVAAANTAASTITIKVGGAATIYSAIPVRKDGTSALSGLEWLSGSVIAVVYDGTYFQLLNPRVGSATTTPTSSNAGTGFNLSFEDDLDSSGVPDMWTPAYFTGGTILRSSTQTVSGGYSVEFHSTSASGSNGGGSLTTTGFIPCKSNSVWEISWWMYCSAATMTNAVKVQFYDSAQAATGSLLTIWSTPSTGNPTSVWNQYGAIRRTPSAAKYFKLTFIGGDVATPASGFTYYDDIQIAAPVFTHKSGTYGHGRVQWQAPAGVYQIKVTLVGGGGTPGIGVVPTSYTAGGGGGGGTAVRYFDVVPATNYGVVLTGSDCYVGAGAVGFSGAVGLAGGSSQFKIGSTTLIATGGGAGAAGSTSGSAGGAGGTYSGEDIGWVGQPGSTSPASANPDLGYGGSTTHGMGGTTEPSLTDFNPAFSGTPNYAGSPWQKYANPENGVGQYLRINGVRGGGGAPARNTVSSYAPGLGGDGLMIIEYVKQ